MRRGGPKLSATSAATPTAGPRVFVARTLCAVQLPDALAIFVAIVLANRIIAAVEAAALRIVDVAANTQYAQHQNHDNPGHLHVIPSGSCLAAFFVIRLRVGDFVSEATERGIADQSISLICKVPAQSGFHMR
jgi:hypothetical protein